MYNVTIINHRWCYGESCNKFVKESVVVWYHWSGRGVENFVVQVHADSVFSLTTVVHTHFAFDVRFEDGENISGVPLQVFVRRRARYHRRWHRKPSWRASWRTGTSTDLDFQHDRRTPLWAPRRGLEPVCFALGNALHALEELGVLFVFDDCVVAVCCAIVDTACKLICNSLHGCGRMTVISGRFWRGASLRGLRQAVARVVGILGRRWWWTCSALALAPARHADAARRGHGRK